MLIQTRTLDDITKNNRTLLQNYTMNINDDLNNVNLESMEIKITENHLEKKL